MAISEPVQYGVMGGACWAVYNVTLTGTTGTDVVVPASEVTFAVPTRITAPALGTYGLYCTWSGNTVTVYSTHDGESDIVVRVLVFYQT